MKLLPCLFLLLLIPAAFAEQATRRTCRILFLEGADDAPKTLQLFDGKESREVELPRMNFSRVYELPTGPLKLYLLPAPPPEPTKIPAAAPAVVIAETLVDFYLLVTSDPANAVAPVRMQVINAGTDKLRLGQTIWFNLTQDWVGGTLGSSTLSIAAGTRTILDSPTNGSEDYPVNLSFRMPGNKQLYPLCETRWRHDPRSRSLAFIIPHIGRRSPRVIVFSDYREPPPKKP